MLHARSRKKLSRWANAIRFTRALSLKAPSAAAAADGAAAGADGAADAAAGDDGARQASAPEKGRGGSLSARLQAQLMARSEKAQGLLQRRPGAGAAGADGQGHPAAAHEAGDAAAGAAERRAKGANVNAKLKALAHKAAAAAGREG